MLKRINGSDLIPYIKSLKEIESLASNAHQQDKENISPEKTMPAMWEEVLHMARMAPALLTCLQECVELLQDVKEAIEDHPAGSISPGAHAFNEDGVQVLDYCRNVLTMVAMGAHSTEQTIH